MQEIPGQFRKPPICLTREGVRYLLCPRDSGTALRLHPRLAGPFGALALPAGVPASSFAGVAACVSGRSSGCARLAV
jgi:hypothetical protein